MDFPKSVPGIGLVNGRFIDENPVTGQQGSLITSAWGNQVTDEILNVLAEAKTVASNPKEFTPSEEKSNQLAQAIKTIINHAIPNSLSEWQDIENIPTAIKSLTNIITVNTTLTLTNDKLGIVVIDATAHDIVITLPPVNNTNLAANVTLFRLDNTANRVTIKAVTDETIYFHTKQRAKGYGFFYLMGAGDYWQMASNGNDGWIKINRLDDTVLGRVSFDTTLQVPEGGYLMPYGTLLNRAEYPWLWDFAQQSGMIVNDADFLGNDGCFTTGNGSTTFRIPDLRGLFLRSFDAGRGVDINRRAGSWQRGSVNAADPSQTTSLVMGLYNTAGDDLEDFWFRAGYDRSNINIYSTLKGMSVLATQSHPYDVTLGVSRPVNGALPVYIKII